MPCWGRHYWKRGLDLHSWRTPWIMPPTQSLSPLAFLFTWCWPPTLELLVVTLKLCCSHCCRSYYWYVLTYHWIYNTHYECWIWDSRFRPAKTESKSHKYYSKTLKVVLLSTSSNSLMHTRQLPWCLRTSLVPFPWGSQWHHLNCHSKPL